MSPCWGGDCSCFPWILLRVPGCRKEEVPSHGCGGPSCHLGWQHCLSCPFQSSARPPGRFCVPSCTSWMGGCGSQPLRSVANEVFSCFLAGEKSLREKTTPEKVFKTQIFFSPGYDAEPSSLCRSDSLSLLIECLKGCLFLLPGWAGTEQRQGQVCDHQGWHVGKQALLPALPLGRAPPEPGRGDFLSPNTLLGHCQCCPHGWAPGTCEVRDGLWGSCGGCATSAGSESHLSATPAPGRGHPV